MALSRIIIKNYKSIKHCNIKLSELNVFIGENGAGKTNILEAVQYFYDNLTESSLRNDIFDRNNPFSNEVRIALEYDLSSFVKIAKSHLSSFTDGKASTDYNSYYKKIVAIAGQEHLVKIELVQVKGQKIQWNMSFKDRSIIKSLFPVFFINTRSLDVAEWSYIWELLGELGKVSYSERRMIEAKIKSFIEMDSHEMSQKFKRVLDVFNESEVNVKRATPKDFAKNLTKVLLSGNYLLYSEKEPDYYSTGTSSVKYIELILYIIRELSLSKMKSPVVILDEPEISLHPQLIDKLSDAINDNSEYLRILLSTHSSRLTKNVIANNGATSLFNVRRNERYSFINKMDKFPQYSPVSKYRVVDDHINAYFARSLLFVEGESELELFANPYIRELFPVFKEVTVIKAMSDKPTLAIVNPSRTKSSIPYTCLVDFDKAAEYDINAKSFIIKDLLNGNASEKYRFINKFHSTQNPQQQYKRILAMANSLHVHYYLPFYGCNDLNYYAFLSAVHMYLLNYNIFTLRTTLEGALINKHSFDLTMDYIKIKHPYKYSRFSNYWNSLKMNDKENVLRLVFCGRSDLLSHKKAMESLPSGVKRNIQLVKVKDKTSGWISEYMDFFFQQVTGISPNSFNERRFRLYIDNKENKNKVTLEFKKCFPELYSLIKRLCDNIK